MRRPALSFLICLTLATLACNAPFIVGNSVTGTSPGLTAAADLPTGGSPPVVQIEAPGNGTQAVVKQPLTIRVHATDSIGITRVELHESGRVVVSQPSPDPNPDFTALLTYRPSNVGRVTLEVVAYRQSAASNAVTITVEVVASTSELRNPASFDPTSGAASDAACSARANISGLSLRAGPGTNYRILSTLKVGEEVSVNGRNADASWYLIKRTGNAVPVGWVSAPYMSTNGDCNRAPVTTPMPQ